MAKWADFLISGVWFRDTANSRYISHVILHLDKEDSMDLGEKQIKDTVIQLIKKKYSVITIKWDYKTATWVPGGPAGYEKIDGIEYLRTDPDALVTDNLVNLIDMEYFKFG